MRRSQLCALACVAICLVASTAYAQPQRGGRGGFGGGFGASYAFLTANENVQGELKLTDEQKGKLQTLREEAFGGGGGGRGPGRDASDEERARFREEQAKRTEEQNKKVEGILNAEQYKRLKEISLWSRGNGALADEAVAKELNLTKEQKDQVATITGEVMRRTRELGRDAAPAERTKVRTDADAEYLGVLTAEQKTKFEALKGAKPSYELNMFGGGGGRQGRRRGNN